METKEVKLRVWNTRDKRMYEPVSFDKLMRYLLFQDHPNAEAVVELKRHYDDHIWMRSTGFKDNAGREIFEGDLLAPEDGFDCSEKCLPVYWSEDGGAWSLYQCGHEEEMLVDWAERSKVIGNVHENPELCG